MTLESIYLIVQTLAGLAVVVSLVYVGVQIRQNTRAAKLAAAQAHQAAIGGMEAFIIQDRSFAELIERGMGSVGGALPNTDRIRLNIFYRYGLRTFQSAHYLFRQRALDPSFGSLKPATSPRCCRPMAAFAPTFRLRSTCSIQRSWRSVNA